MLMFGLFIWLLKGSVASHTSIRPTRGYQPPIFIDSFAHLYKREPRKNPWRSNTQIDSTGSFSSPKNSHGDFGGSSTQIFPERVTDPNVKTPMAPIIVPALEPSQIDENPEENPDNTQSSPSIITNETPDDVPSPDPEDTTNDQGQEPPSETKDTTITNQNLPSDFLSDLLRIGVTRPNRAQVEKMQYEGRVEWHYMMLKSLSGIPSIRSENLFWTKWRNAGLMSSEINFIQSEARKVWRDNGVVRARKIWEEEEQAGTQRYSKSKLLTLPSSEEELSQDQKDIVNKVSEGWAKEIDEIKATGVEHKVLWYEKNWVRYLENWRWYRIPRHHFDFIFQTGIRTLYWAPVSGAALKERQSLLEEAWEEWGDLEAKHGGFIPSDEIDTYVDKWLKRGLTRDETMIIWIRWRINRRSRGSPTLRLDIHSLIDPLDVTINGEKKENDDFKLIGSLYGHEKGSDECDS